MKPDWRSLQERADPAEIKDAIHNHLMEMPATEKWSVIRCCTAWYCNSIIFPLFDRIAELEAENKLLHDLILDKKTNGTIDSDKRTGDVR